MYWTNQIHTIESNQDSDIIEQSQHDGQHCLFYDPAINIIDIQRVLQLKDICQISNHQLANHHRELRQGNCWQNEIANIVRINMFVHSMRKIGSVKPMLLHYDQGLPYTASTGGTRLMAAELIPEITHVSGFVTTHQRHRLRFSHLPEIKCWSDFVKYCGTEESSTVLIRLTDAAANWGIDWFEVAVDQHQGTRIFVPQDDWCLAVLQNYVNCQPEDFKFTPEWFNTQIAWDLYYAS
jgi:hypothetical protein